MIDVAAVVHFPEVLASFRRDRPDVELVLTVAPSATLFEHLRDGRLDLAIGVAPDPLPLGVRVAPLLDEPLVVYAPRGIRIGAPPTWGPWVLFPSDSHSRRQIERALVAAGAPVRVAAESHQPDVLGQMVELGLGWTVLPAVQAPQHATAGPELAVRQLACARREGAVSDPAVDRLERDLLTHVGG